MPDENDKTTTEGQTPEPSPPAAAPTVEPDDSEDKTFDEAYVKKLRSEAASNRVKANELQTQLEELSAQFNGLEEKYKSQFEQRFDELKATLEAEKKAREEAERRATRLEVQAKTGLPDELVDRLRGDSLDEMLEDAKALMSIVKPVGVSNHPGMGKSIPPGAGSPPPAENLAAEIYKRIRQGPDDSPYK